MIARATAEGRAVCPFSNLHIQEAVHHSEKSKGLAVDRARVMRRLSCASVYAPLEHVLIHEVEAVLKDRGLLNEPAPAFSAFPVRTDGKWWPWESFSELGELDIKKEVFKLAENDHSIGVNREQRRRLKKHRASLEARLIQQIDIYIPELQAKLAEIFPPSEELSDPKLLRRYLRGEVDESVVYNILMNVALDPEVIVNWTVDRMKAGGSEACYLRAAGYKMTADITTLLQNMCERSIPLSITADVMRAFQDRMIRDLADSLRKSLLNATVGLASENQPTWTPEFVDLAKAISHSASDVEMPGIASIISGLCSWIKILITPSKTPQKVLRSDVLDIFHSAYLPYVDCFRADSRFYNVLQQAKSPYLDKVNMGMDGLADIEQRLIRIGAS